MDCSNPSFLALHYLPRFAQTHVHWVGDAIQPSHLPFPPSPPTLNFSQHRDLFQQVNSSGGQSIGTSASASILPVNIQDWFPLELTSLISFQSKGFSRVFSSTTTQNHQFFGAQPSLWSNSHIHTWLLEKPQVWCYGTLLAKWCLCFSGERSGSSNSKKAAVSGLP